MEAAWHEAGGAAAGRGAQAGCEADAARGGTAQAARAAWMQPEVATMPHDRQIPGDEFGKEEVILADQARRPGSCPIAQRSRDAGSDGLPCAAGGVARDIACLAASRRPPRRAGVTLVAQSGKLAHLALSTASQPEASTGAVVTAKEGQQLRRCRLRGRGALGLQLGQQSAQTAHTICSI